MKKIGFLFLISIIIVVFIINSRGGYFCKNLPCKNHIFGKTYYLVQKGDSINRIATQYQILPWQLRKENHLGAKDDLIHPGQRLLIPDIVWKSYKGRASWYGPGFHGKKMANGEVYNQNKVLVAHRTFPLGLRVRITNLKNSKSIIAEVLDRGPYTKKNGKYDREVDLSYKAAKLLGVVKPGIISVQITPL